MAKRTTLRDVEISPIATGQELETAVLQLFVAAKFEVSRKKRIVPEGAAFLAIRQDDLGRDRGIAVEISAHTNTRHLHERERLARQALNGLSEDGRLDEYWIIYTQGDWTLTGYKPILDRRVRVLRLDELQAVLAPKRARTKSKARTRTGKAALANEKEINLAIDGLVLQINARLESLNAERPNSDAAQSRVAHEISQFERMQTELYRIRDAVAAFKKGKVAEQEVVTATTIVKRTVEQWWSKKGEEIINSTAKGAILVSFIGVLALMKADNAVAIAAVAAVVNGGVIGKAKKIGQAAKRLAKRRIAEGEDGMIQ